MKTNGPLPALIAGTLVVGHIGVQDIFLVPLAASIAHQLVLSPETVKDHLERICRKLGATDRTAAVAEAMRRGFIE